MDPDPEDDRLPDDDLVDTEAHADHSWEQLEEDEQGHLRTVNVLEEQRMKRRRALHASEYAHVRRGMIRYVVLVLDYSRAASVQDLRPSRLSLMLTCAKTYVREFFDQNPLSHLGIVSMRNGIAEQLTELSGSPETQVSRLSQGMEASGDASLQNALTVSLNALKSVPPYGHREVIIIFAALTTCDPGNILETIKLCKDQRIRVSIVGVSAEVYICKKVCEETGGVYGVALNEAHLEELLMTHAPPPPVPAGQGTAQLVRMGFPRRSASDQASEAFVGVDCVLRSGHYECPKCKARVTELPSNCHVCGLTLILSPHLARSYHHLFPVPPYQEVMADQMAVDTGPDSAAAAAQLQCFGCLRSMAVEAVASIVAVQCTYCRQYFCLDCDMYIHESLHNCPGCECSAVT